MGPPQTLSEADRRIVAGWAAGCADGCWDCSRWSSRAIAAPATPSLGRARCSRRTWRRRGGPPPLRRQWRSSVTSVLRLQRRPERPGRPRRSSHGRVRPGCRRVCRRAAALAARDRQEAVDEEMSWKSVICPRRPEPPCDSGHSSGRIHPVRLGPAPCMGNARHDHPEAPGQHGRPISGTAGSKWRVPGRVGCLWAWDLLRRWGGGCPWAIRPRRLRVGGRRGGGGCCGQQ